ncbi:MAG: FHA domain-containing protein [Longimicrobiales bacterium]
MLPGRLQPINTSVIQQEIRFVRVPSEEQVVTLGWNLGEPPEHVTLNHSSIQPLHARMTYREGQWWMESLDRNDPVVINSAVLRPASPPRPLADGDQIRIGAALFRFFFP